MTISNRTAWFFGMALILGSWLMQQPQNATWAVLFTPFNIGSLLAAIGGAYVTGKFVTPKP